MYIDGAFRSRFLAWSLRGGVAALAAASALALAPIPAAATISGPCHGTGYSIPRASVKSGGAPDLATLKSTGTTVDFQSASVWTVPSWMDYLAGVGNSDGAMSSGFAYVTAFGFQVPVAGGTGSGSSGSGGPISAYDIAKDHMPPPFNNEPPARVISAAGGAIPDPNGKPPAAGPCAGAILIEFQDANAASTVVGQVGIAIMVVGAAGIAGVAIRRY